MYRKEDDEAFQIRHFGCVSSTQDVAKELAGSGAAVGTVVVADEQKRGRGRFGRTWISPKGGLYASVILDPSPLLPLRVGVAVAEALRAVGINARLKWPNDVMVGERKIAGLLIESIDECAIVGIGVNLTAKPMSTASSIVQEVSMEVTRDDLLQLILRYFKATSSETVLARYQALSATIGQAVRVEISGPATPPTVVGRAVGIDPSGRLLVSVDGAVHPVASGECVHVRAASQEERQRPNSADAPLQDS